MASYVCRVQTIQRSAGRSAVSAAAYRSGQALTDERATADISAQQAQIAQQEAADANARAALAERVVWSVLSRLLGQQRPAICGPF